MVFFARALSLVVLAILALAPVRCLASCTEHAQQIDQDAPCHQQHDGKSSSGCSQHYELKAFDNGQQHHQLDSASVVAAIPVFHEAANMWDALVGTPLGSSPRVSGPQSTVLRI